jgi:hypothetical protein
MRNRRNKAAKRFFEGLLRRLDAQPARPPALGSLRIITFSTFKAGATPLERTARLHGAQPVVLRPPRGRGWSNRLKTRLVLDYLSSTDAEVCLITDSRDVVLLQSPDEMLHQFESMGVPSLLSAERVSCPDDKELTLAEERCRRQQTTWVYGNSGGLIGRTPELLRLYQKALEFGVHPTRPRCDQYGVRKAALALGVPRDEECRFFYTLNLFSAGDAAIEEQP